MCLFASLLKQKPGAARDAADASGRLHAILDNTVDGIITIDEKGRVETYNKACEKVFGYTADEVIGQNIKMLMPEEYAAHHDQYLANYLRTGEAKIIGIGREARAKRKDGSEFPIDLSVAEVMDKSNTRFFSGIIRDITARKQAEEEIYRSNTELERFAYIASHDLQEPLRMVSNFTDLLNREYGQKMDGDAVKYMTFIVDASRRMQALVNDLLEYSRIGNSDERYTEFSANDAMKMAVDNLSHVIASTEAQVTYDPLPDLYWNQMFYTRLVQNLIENAIKYRRSGVRPEIHISCKDFGDTWQFSVKDNGIGIKKEYFSQVFVLFKRLHSRHEYSGTGIGLSICKKIVESAGGHIWLNSTFGKGTTFYFTLPKNTAMKEAA